MLIVHARPQRMADVQELPDPVPDLPTMRSEVDLLQSRSVIEPVVRSMELWRRRNFKSASIRGDGPGRISKIVLSEMWSAVSGATEEEAGTPPQPPRRRAIPTDRATLAGCNRPSGREICPLSARRK